MKYSIYLAGLTLAACTTTTGAANVTVACGSGLVLLNNMCQLPDGDAHADTGGQVLTDAVGDAPAGASDVSTSLLDAGDADTKASDTGIDASTLAPAGTIQCAPDNCHAKVAGAACACSNGGCYFAASSASCVSDADCCPRVTAAFTMSGSKKVPQPAPVYDVCVEGKCTQPGTQCNDNSQCWVMPSGLVAPGTCESGSCSWPTKGLGEPCAPKSKVAECAPTLACNGGIATPALNLPYACRPATCDAGTDCGPGAVCSVVFKTCMRATGECEPSYSPCEAGKTCTLATCHYDPVVGTAKNYVCVDSSAIPDQYPAGIDCVASVFCPIGTYCGNDKKCRQPPDKEGFACVYDPASYQSLCANGLACVGGICGGAAPVLKIGDACSTNADCSTGICALCQCASSKIANGGQCVTDESCASGDCVAGVCAAFTPPVNAPCSKNITCPSGQACLPVSCTYDPSVPYTAVATVQTCVTLPKPTGAAPVPGIACVTSEFCAKGDTCAPDNKCYSPTKTAGAACAPGAGCASPLSCVNGVCATSSGTSGLPIGAYCTSNYQCAAAACVNCQCAATKAASGKSCTDDDSCVSGDCIAGVCK